MSEDKKDRSKRIIEQFEKSLPRIMDAARAETEKIISRSIKKSKVVYISEIKEMKKYRPKPFKNAIPFHLLSEEEQRQTMEAMKDEDED